MAGRVEIVVMTDPVPKGRPRKGRNGRFYTPEETKAFEEHIGWVARSQLHDVFFPDEELSIRLRFCRENHIRADLDNLIKATLDGLNGVAYTDDSQVVHVDAALKRGCDPPYVFISIQESHDEF